MDTPLLFECAAGHRWHTAYKYIQGGSWCWQCYCERSRDGIDKMRALAESHGGKCLSETYENQMQPLRWRCKQGHEWESPAIVAKQHWCMRCYRERRRLGIEKMHELAASRGGRCLSEVYVSTFHPLQWECHLGHRWTAQPQGLLRGSWCPLCANLARSKKHVKRRKYDFEG
ncbi:hypothetical protein AWB73_02846 [Caballeronia turbans]|uniref:hypothetical protein n=1 Tax=Caballeronia sp. INML2 TaxID=2921748 RepID=UPI00074D03D5|nr:hypothetical protein [Caballeronia sp. INML2]SAL32159.1 hypothetical protein AWB73_02846 [Caballeronia turbans]